LPFQDPGSEPCGAPHSTTQNAKPRLAMHIVRMAPPFVDRSAGPPLPDGRLTGSQCVTPWGELLQLVAMQLTLPCAEPLMMPTDDPFTVNVCCQSSLQEPP